MKLPKMRRSAMSTQTVETFGGYNHNLQIGDGEFYEMQNMTSDHFPVLSPRGARGTVPDRRACALVSSHGLCTVEGGRFYLPDGTDAGVSLTEGEKKLVAMGAYVIILPDKVWVNVAATGEEGRWGRLESCFRKTDAGITFQPCRADGTVYDNISEAEPKEPTDGQMWLDTTGEYPALRQWSETVGAWVFVTTGYVRVQTAGIGAQFEKGDSVQVKLDGIGMDKKNALRYIGELTPAEHPELDTQDWGTLRATWVIHEKTEYYIVIAGYLGIPMCGGQVGIGDNAFPGELLLERKLPDMDLVVESGNRLWGCRYGNTENGFVNEIYASKLGDFKNFYCFQGISTDSYIASVGADGPFTGAVSYMGRPVFFKENCMLEVFGNYPSNYQLQATPCAGVQEGCQRSLAIVNNVLYYKSGSGICAYDGSLPVQLGQELGGRQYDSAVAGSLGNKYYISMRDMEGGGYSLFVYDCSRGLWHREDSLQVKAFCVCKNTLYAIAEGESRILTMDGSGTQDKDPVPWMVQTGRLGLHLPESKYVSRLTLRLSMTPGSSVSVYVCYDSSGSWEHLHTVQCASLRSVTLPLCPRRCDHMQLRLEGLGEAKLYALTKTVEQGGNAG